MANYEVAFETDMDSSTHGHRGSRRFSVEARSAKEAVQLAYVRFDSLIRQGYVRVDFGFRGEVRRDRSSPNLWYTGRRHDDSNDPRWTFIIISTLESLGFPIRLTKVGVQ